MIWEVAVEAPLAQVLSYLVPEQLSLSPLLIRGQSVTVPLGRRQVKGVLIRPIDSTANTFALKEIINFDLERPVLPDAYVNWIEWLSSYYIYPIGQTFEMAFPPLSPAKKERKSKKPPVTPELPPTHPPTLTAEQIRVVSDIQSTSGFMTHLIHGVTGSGKTEVYMRLLEDVISKNQQGIVLVPEISLTPQLIDRFSSRFGNAIAVIHSHLTPREKTNQWWKMISGDKQILIGARSALFCPLPRLGMVVIDEEHESSFKQDEKLKYHARDAAIMLGKFMDCPIVLGSATPSLETWQNVLQKRYQLHQLKSRVENRRLPDIRVVDLRAERDLRKQSGEETLPFWLSLELYNALKDNLENGLQSALFLNRRGIAQAVVCPDCGYVPACPNCAVKLTLHGKSHLLCHYCDFHQTLTEHCPSCPDGEPKPIGLGTELIENDLRRLFPKARLARMDRDEISNREDLEEMIHEIENREVDILVGTQMIAKGLDFPGLTLVGLVMADVSFNLPDFRATERSFQLLTQVSGRSGRHLDEGSGQVIIQTYNPSHPSIQYTCSHDFDGFTQYELQFREQLCYPPFSRLGVFRIQGSHLDKVKAAATKLRARAESLKKMSEHYTQIELLGPAEAPLSRIRNHHRWQMLIKAPKSTHIGSFCRRLLGKQDWVPSTVKILVDIDAVHLL